MAEIEIFTQGQGLPEITLIKVEETGTVREFVELAISRGQGFEGGVEDLVVFLEDSETGLPLNVTIKQAGFRHHGRVHIHPKRLIEVTVHYDNRSEVHPFAPSTTVAKVKKWADDKFGLHGVDATEHLLEICGTTIRPDEDVHIGTLTHGPEHKLCFNLVPKIRVEG